MVQNHKLGTVEESQESESVSTHPNTDLPNIIRIDQFLEILRRYRLQFFDQAHNPGHFCGLLT